MPNLLQSLFGKQSLSLFIEMAETVTGEYVETVTEQIIATGAAPSFEQMMQMVKSLNNDLHLKAVWLMDNYKHERSKKSAKLTRGCKSVIDKSIQDFVRTVKLIEKTKAANIAEAANSFSI